MEVIKLKDLPELERPREKARHFGINKLTNIELLALIIGSGTKDMNVLMVATNLLTYARSIDALLDFSYQDYLKITGIKEATALRFLAISELLKRRGLSERTIDYTDSKNVACRYRYIIGNNKNESMYLIAVNDQGHLIYEKELYVGTKQTFVSSEEEIIDELLEILVKAGKVTDKASAKECVLDRERKMSTGMKHGIAIPHGKTDTVSDLVACIGVSDNPVDFDYLKNELGDEYIILFRAHYLVADKFDFAKYDGFVVNVSDYDDINELYNFF